jgi:hypothetical protein
MGSQKNEERFLKWRVTWQTGTLLENYATSFFKVEE